MTNTQLVMSQISHFNNNHNHICEIIPCYETNLHKQCIVSSHQYFQDQGMDVDKCRDWKQRFSVFVLHTCNIGLELFYVNKDQLLNYCLGTTGFKTIVGWQITGPHNFKMKPNILVSFIHNSTKSWSSWHWYIQGKHTAPVLYNKRVDKPENKCNYHFRTPQVSDWLVRSQHFDR
ncbi:hypothetical protein AGLY_006341 [Aphis glycines]|uniref:Uncharacterized protein n=1 Tax=Aphis glycines TaxID=307491 RepID=A0A6G0TS15_APHGL|nr:hypothetical protein AGLY_006341 [Aphis glycines]